MPTGDEILQGVALIFSDATFVKFFVSAMGLTFIGMLLRRIFQ